MNAAEATSASDALREPLHHHTSPLADIIEEARRIAQTSATVLLTGETGTGKEVFARFVHEASGRKGRFISLNCGAIPETLVESELFGHAKGAFTGAQGARKGRVALARGGTLFLDEIGELKMEMQVKLLRLLQERTYEAVGSDDTQQADFRLIAATNRDLEQEVAAGRFRADLFYRLLVCPLHLPPLRARPMDVPVLFQHCWRTLGERRTITDEVFTALSSHPWPGNVRELENLVERLSVCTLGDCVTLRDLPLTYRPAVPSDPPAAARPVAPPAPQASALPPLHAAPPSISTGALQDPLVRPASAITALPDAGHVPPGLLGDALPTNPAASPPPAAWGAAPNAWPGAYADPRPAPVASASPAGWLSAAELPFAFATAEDGLGLTASERSLLLDAPEPAFDDNGIHITFPVDLPAILRELEDRYIDAALLETAGNKQAAADLLGLRRTTLVEKLRRRAGREPTGSVDSTRF